MLFPAAAGAQGMRVVDDPANLMGEQVSPQSPADRLPINHGVPALQQMLLKLRTRASLMMIVAHPDDEDGGFLTFESRGMGARVAMLTLNRGEGGQNLMSGDFDEALGLIRTQELLEEDRYTGGRSDVWDGGRLRVFEDQGGNLRQVDARACALRRGARRAALPAAGTGERVCGRTDGRARAPPGLRRDHAGGVYRGRGPERLSGDDPRGAAAVEAAEGVRAGAVFAYDQGRDVRLRDGQDDPAAVPELCDGAR